MDDGLGRLNFTDVFGGDINDQQVTLVTSYVAYNLTKGLTYGFRYRAKNIYGWSSDWSPITYILAADVPTQPAEPILTAASDSSMSLKFSTCPDNGGSQILEHELHMNTGVDGSAFSIV